MGKLLWVVAGIVFGGGLGWLALQGMEWGEVARSFAALDWRWLVMATGAVLFAGLLEAIRWKLLLPAEKVSAKRLFLVKYVGKGLNNMSPIRIVAEVAQTTMLRYGDGIRLERIVSSLLLVRLFDFLVTVSLVGVGLIVLPQLAGFRPVVLPMWVLSLVSIAGLLLLAKHLHKLPGVGRFQAVQSLMQSMGSLGGKRLAMLGCFALTALAWMSIGTAAWLVGMAAGIELPMWLMAVVIVAVTMISGSVPAPPGAVGVYEFAAITTLGLFAVDAAVALTFALVIHALIFIPPVIVALVVLATERRTFQHVIMAVRQVFSTRFKRTAAVES